ncbi:MAG: hypothetical protein ACI9MU_001005, partial [Alphaproteobacteria bacterium]
SGKAVPALVRAPQRGAARSLATSAVTVFSPVLIGVSFRFSGARGLAHAVSCRTARPIKAHNKERRARFSPDTA